MTEKTQTHLKHRYFPLVQIDRQQRDRRRGDASDAGRLPQRAWPDTRELLPRLARETGHRGVIDILRQADRLEVLRALDRFELAVDVARVFGLDLGLERDI